MVWRDLSFFGGLLCLSACGNEALYVTEPEPPVWDCLDYSTCQWFESAVPCSTDFVLEVCDGKDNDCDGDIDEYDPLAGEPCQGGASCQSGTYVCQAGALVCNAGSSGPSQEVLSSEVEIGFDFYPTGIAIPDGTTISDQYDSIGVTFGGGFSAVRRTRLYGCYGSTDTLNLLCTASQAVSGQCVSPTGSALVAWLDDPVDIVTVNLGTRCDGPDGDQGTVTAYDALGALVDSVTVHGHTSGSSTPEAIAVAEVRGSGIVEVRIDPGDFDSIDTLRLGQLAGPSTCP